MMDGFAASRGFVLAAPSDLWQFSTHRSFSDCALGGTLWLGSPAVDLFGPGTLQVLLALFINSPMDGIALLPLVDIMVVEYVRLCICLARVLPAAWPARLGFLLWCHAADR
mmetsp:Transcript_166133/g.533247  ORF Transcript_166133/g.533247 Transcript_166133/m.533247 type:complete len:111 (+) Transcript_166133:2062-2394(+)